jgi:dihydrofolate reductase
LIQRLVLTRIPVLLGDGIPLFGPLRHDVRLKHVGTRAFPSGMVQSEYLVPEAEDGS